MKATLRPSNQIVTILSKPPQMKTTMGIPGPVGPSGAGTIHEMSDVDISGIQDGSLLIYNATNNKWEAGNLLNAQAIECGEY